MSWFLGTCSYNVRYAVLTSETMKSITFWYVTPCSLTEVFRHFWWTCCLRLRGLKVRRACKEKQGTSRSACCFIYSVLTMEAVYTYSSYVSVNFCQTTRCNITHHRHRRENLISYTRNRCSLFKRTRDQVPLPWKTTCNLGYIPLGSHCA
jgi:hypothetical protein